MAKGNAQGGNKNQKNNQQGNPGGNPGVANNQNPNIPQSNQPPIWYSTTDNNRGNNNPLNGWHEHFDRLERSKKGYESKFAEIVTILYSTKETNEKAYDHIVNKAKGSELEEIIMDFKLIENKDNIKKYFEVRWGDPEIAEQHMEYIEKHIGWDNYIKGQVNAYINTKIDQLKNSNRDLSIVDKWVHQLRMYGGSYIVDSGEPLINR